MADIQDNDRKCALYVRVSTSRQALEGDSLDEQVKTLETFCSYRNWQNIKIYREEGFSGKNMNRPAYQRMMSDIKMGKINTVIVKKVDRLSRSIVDFEDLYSQFEKQNVDLISLQENFDTSNAIGRSVIRIVLVFAQLEREQTSERTIDAMAYRAQQGLFNGGYPRLGYDIDAETKRLIPCENEIPIVRELFNSYIRLGSLSATATHMNSKGYRLKTWVTKNGEKRGGDKFQKTSLSRILNDQLYIGKIKHNGKHYEGQHQAIISEDLFNAVQGILNANNLTKSGYRQADNTFLLKGLVRCGVCKSSMAPSFSKTRGKKYFYYRCNVDNDRSKSKCRIGSVHSRKIEQLVVDELKFISKDQRIIEGVVENATKEQRGRAKELSIQRKTIQDTLFHVDKKAKNLIAVLSEGGTSISSSGYLVKQLEEMDLQSSQLRKELESIDFQINDLENKLLSADIILKNFKTFNDAYDHLTTEEKYDLLHLLVKKVVYYEESEIDMEGKKTGKIKMDLWELPPIDPSKLSPADHFAERPLWLPNPDSNQGQGD